jgi:hypothetical protein
LAEFNNSFLITALFVSNYVFAGTFEMHCPKEEIPLKWQSCKRSSDCVSIYQRCIIEAINKNFETKVKDWLKACNACDATAISHEHAVCKDKKCELDPPYPAAPKTE